MILGSCASIADFFSGLDFTKPQDLARSIQGVVDTIASMITITEGMVDQLRPLFDFVVEGVKKFNQSDDSLKKTAGNVIALAMEFEKFGLGPVAAINLLSDKLLALFDILVKIERLPFQIAKAIQNFYTPFDVENIRRSWSDIFSMQHILGPATEDAKKLSGEVVEWWSSAATSSAEKVDKALDEGGESWKKYRDVSMTSMSAISDEALPEVIDGLGQAKDKQDSFQRMWKSEDGTIYFQQVKDAAAEAGVEIGEGLPEAWKNNLRFFEAESKRLSDMLQFEATIQTKQMEVDIARIDAMAQATSAAFDSISKSIESTGTGLTDLWGIFAGGGLSPHAWVNLRDTLRAEEARRQESFDLQRELTEKQIEQSELEIEALRLRNQKLSRGESIINVSAEGLKPHLEAIMWEILEAVQIRASEDGIDLLLGST